MIGREERNGGSESPGHKTQLPTNTIKVASTDIVARAVFGVAVVAEPKNEP